MMQKIKTILDRKLGLRISRSAGRLEKYLIKDNRKSPLYIDFMGPSGVGKTTLFNVAYKNRDLLKPWFTPAELIHNSKEKKNNIIDDIYQDVAELKFNDIKEQAFYNPVQKLQQFAFVNKVLKEEINIQNLNKNHAIVFEDGFYHVYGREIVQLLQQDENKYNLFIKNRALILCVAPANIIAEQIFKRKNKEGLRAQHIGKNLKELIVDQEKVLKERREIADFIKQKNVPVLTIDTSKNIEKNAKNVLDFIESL